MSSEPKQRRPRGSLTPEVILDAAEAVASEGGTVGMRAVAARVGAVPMALYNHFATKEQLVDALLDRVLARFEPEPETGEWLEDLRRFARTHRSLLVRHPWAVAPLFSRPNPGPAAVRIGEIAFAILQRGGLSERDAVAVFSGVIALNYGWSSFTIAPDLDPAFGSDRDYEFVLDQLVAGLRTTCA